MYPSLVNRRLQVLDEVLQHLSSASKREEILKQALKNVQRWHRNMEQPQKQRGRKRPCVVRVIKGDWGDVTATLTKEFGTVFAVLNMANSHVAGGGYLDGMPAQEENMFRRTDCHYNITNGSPEKIMILYEPKMTDLLNAENGRVYLDSEHPRICVRGSEKDDYRWLDKDEVFPFYELRAAALDCRTQKFSADSAKKRIKAQFETLRSRKVQHVVLSAFGCGKYH